MPVLMIGYQPVVPDADDQPVVDAVQGLGSCWRFLPRAWLVDSPYTTRKARERVIPHLRDGDRLVIVVANKTGDWTVHNTSDQGEAWLRRHLPPG